MDQDLALFDRLVDQAWPAPLRSADGGWVHRYAGGVTKRANSVLALGERADLAQAIARAERFYAGHGLPCVFFIGAGATPGLDAELDRRGYRVADPTLIMTVPLDRVAPPDGAAREGKIDDVPSERWLRTWWRVDGGRHRDDGEIPARSWAERIMTGVPAGYLLREEGAVGRAVPQGGWLGIYCMAVQPEARRRGLATAVLRGLLAWGREQGTRHAYLVVTEANAAARALYERAGFTVTGRYHYRVGPE